ncbi:MAG: dCMP deaminase family protein [Leptolyngbyaceae bacterium]|nr:dCMP deaminase family protein [Leptolyngbyaceae bacterium]
MSGIRSRPSWDEYFLILAKLAAIRSTCIARQVGAVIVKDRQVLATGYNGPPSGLAHCTDQGYCYPDLADCEQSDAKPSRAIHAEANAIAQAARHGIPTENASIYVTLEPCLSCLKLIISAGISQVYYETSFRKTENQPLRDDFIAQGLVTLKQIALSPESAAMSASIFLEALPASNESN